MKNIFQHVDWREMLRFGVVGLIATAIHYGIYVLLIQYLSENIAYTIGWLISLTCNFYLSSRFTFRQHMSFSRAGGFAGSHVMNYLLHISLFNFFLWVGVAPLYAPLIVYCIVIPINFILVRLVFTKLP